MSESGEDRGVGDLHDCELEGNPFRFERRSSMSASSVSDNEIVEIGRIDSGNKYQVMKIEMPDRSVSSSSNERNEAHEH